MWRKPEPSRVIRSTLQPGIGQSLFMLRPRGFRLPPPTPVLTLTIHAKCGSATPKGEVHLAARQLALEQHASLGIGTVHLKQVLGDVEANGSNLHSDVSRLRGRCTPLPRWHFDAVSGRRPSHHSYVRRDPIAVTGPGHGRREPAFP